MGAVRVDDYKYRFIDQPGGWLGGTVKTDFPILTNLRLDPLERTGLANSFSYFDFFKFALCRTVFVQQVVQRHAQSFIDFPPMQKPASFNLDAVKATIEIAIKAHDAGA